GFYNAADRIGFAHGFGNVKLRPPEASHCNNVGPSQRAHIYPYFERWFAISKPPDDVASRPADQLVCLTAEAKQKFQLNPVHELPRALALERGAAARAARDGLAHDARRQTLRDEWTSLLGDITPKPPLKIDVREKTELANARL